MSDSNGETTSGTSTGGGGGDGGGASTSSSPTTKHNTKMVVENKFSSSSREMRNMAEKMRRDKLNTYVAEIASIVPMGSGANKRIDKTSVLRLAANYIRMHKVLKDDDDEPNKLSPILDKEVTKSLAEAVGGFLLLVTSTGKILYVTEAVDQCFGHSQVDLLGHTIYSVIHPDDHDFFQQQLVPRENSRRSFFCRMMEKALSRNDPGRYEIIHVVGQLKKLPQLQSSTCSVMSPTALSPATPSSCETNISGNHDGEESSDTEGDMHPLKVANRTGTHMLVSFVRVVKDRPITELSLIESTQDQYITRHGMDGRILYTDHRISFVTGLMPSEVVGTSAFTYMHQEDVLWSIVAQKLMFTSTQGEGIVSYRLKCKNGEFVTLKSRGFLEVNKQTGQVESFVCINTVLSVKDASSEIRNQRRNLLPIIACHETDEHLGSISSALPPELLNVLKQIMNPLAMQKMIESVKKGESSLKEELAECEELQTMDVSVNVPSNLFALTDGSEPSTVEQPNHHHISHSFQSKPKRPHCEDYKPPSEACPGDSNVEKDQWLRIAKKRSSVDDFTTVVSKRFTFERDLTCSEGNQRGSSSSETPGHPYSPSAPYSCPSTSLVPEMTKSYSTGTCQNYNCRKCEGATSTNVKAKYCPNFQNAGTKQSCNWQQNCHAVSPSSMQCDQSALTPGQYGKKPSPQLLSPSGYNQNVTSPVPTSVYFNQSKVEDFLLPDSGNSRLTDSLSPTDNQRLSEVQSLPENKNQIRVSSLAVTSNIIQNQYEVVPSGSNCNVMSCNQSSGDGRCQSMSTASSYPCIEKKSSPTHASCNQIDVRSSLSCPVTSHCSYPISGDSVVSPKDEQILMPQNQLYPQYQQVSVCVSHSATPALSPCPQGYSVEQNLSIPIQSTPSTSPGHYVACPQNVQKQTNSYERQIVNPPNLGLHSVPITSSHKMLYVETGMEGVAAVPEAVIPEQHLTNEDHFHKDTGSVFSNGHFQLYRSSSQQGGKLS